jgi:hypothetical protein
MSEKVKLANTPPAQLYCADISFSVSSDVVKVDGKHNPSEFTAL